MEKEKAKRKDVFRETNWGEMEEEFLNTKIRPKAIS